MEKKKRETPIDKDVLKVGNEAEEFSKSELEVLNLVAQIIVEYVLNEEK